MVGLELLRAARPVIDYDFVPECGVPDHGLVGFHFLEQGRANVDVNSRPIIRRRGVAIGIVVAGYLSDQVGHIAVQYLLALCAGQMQGE